MLITTRLRYAVMFMAKLAQEHYASQNKIQPKKMSYIASSQSLSEGYLEQIIVKLKKGGLINAIKGPGGGYSLNIDPKLVTLNLIVESIGEHVKIKRCSNNFIRCTPDNKLCTTHNLWDDIENYIKDYLNSISLDDIINNNLKANNKFNNIDDLYIYADYNSTSSMLPIVRKELDNLSSLSIYNASSAHKLGQNTRSIIEKTRETAINELNATKDYEVIFTSSGTEANNLVINSTHSYKHLISSIEHLSIMNCATNAELIPVNSDGILCLDTLSNLLYKFKNQKVLVSIMLANNETGVIQPIKEIVEISHKFGAIVHTDAVQACGKINVDIEDLGVDLLTISSHKIGSIAGVGLLFFNNKKINIKPMILGGQQEKELRAGTENVIAIHLLHTALNNLKSSVNKMSYIKKLRDKLEEDILNLVPEVQIFSKNAERLPNTSCISMPNVDNEIQMISFDINNIAVGNGSACSSGASKSSHVLSAMGISEDIAKTSIRISLSPDATESHVQKIVSHWYMIYQNNQVKKLS